MKNTNRNNVATDIISTLPNDLLMHVLSFLSTREAVQCCNLAKRWRNTWASVPVLKFDLDEFLTDSHDLKYDEKHKECEDKFQQFVNWVLKNREPSYLDYIQYEWIIDENYSEVSMEWLDRVARLMPRVISVKICSKNVLDMHDLVFSCTSLQELELSLCVGDETTIIRPKSINLPSLKVLKLQGVDLDDDFPRKLFFGCPALEILYLGYCDLGFSNISSKLLKTLSLDCNQNQNQMQICCPCLISLDIESLEQTRGISLQNTASLANANITLETDDDDVDDDDEDDDDDDGDHDLNILEGLSNVSTLKLDLRCAKVKEKLKKNILYSINFNNLKTLELGRLDLLNLSKDGNLVAFFLQHSPQLQKLTLNLAKPLKDDPQGPSQEELVEVFQRDYLETVKIIKWKYLDIVEWKRHDPLLRQAIKYLHAHIKKIGKILTS